jgi:hypothetical protein
VALRRHAARDTFGALRVLLAGTFLSVLTGGLWLLPAFEAERPVKPLARAVRERTNSEIPVAAFAFSEPGLIFYLDRPVEEIGTGARVRSWASEPASGVLVTTRSAFAKVLTEGPLPLREIASANGIDTVHGRRLELVALLRGGTP